jgi:CTP:molybdopterin cytidylyltransferase MocA
VTGVLLVGGASTRFGSPKGLATLHGETLAGRAWRILGEAFEARLAGPGRSVWMRQMVLGPSPEYVVRSGAPVVLPYEATAIAASVVTR